MLKAANRISRFHDEKGNFVEPAGLANALPALVTAAGKAAFGYRACR